MPTRIQRKRTKGWAKPFLAVCVTRPSQFGNPFKVGEPAAFRFTNSGEFRATTALRAVPDADRARKNDYPPHVAACMASAQDHINRAAAMAARAS